MIENLQTTDIQNKIQVKICGLRTPETIAAAVDAGAEFLGFVFYPPSSRHLDVDLAVSLAKLIPSGVRTVGLFVNPAPDELEQILTQVPLDMIQLHGNETPEDVLRIRKIYGIEIIKAIPVGDADDLQKALEYKDVAEWMLFDAKPPKGVRALPGGTGFTFDWTILQQVAEWPTPWMLAGGLNATNVIEAIRISGAEAVDVSSGVEDRPGHKDPAKIKAFMDQVRKATGI